MKNTRFPRKDRKRYIDNRLKSLRVRDLSSVEAIFQEKDGSEVNMVYKVK